MGGDWVWYLGAGVLGAGALWLFAWAWWGDRSRGRARCGKCWYSMDALLEGSAAVPPCPECGWKAKQQRQFFRTRRRKWWGAFAVLIALNAAACVALPKVRRDGVWSLAPDGVMRTIAVSGWRPTPSFVDEMVRRFGGKEWMRGDLAQSVYEGNRWVRLTRDVWVKGVPLRARTDSSYGPVGAFSGLSYRPAMNWSVRSNDADPFQVQSHENWWEPGCTVIVPGRADASTSSVGIVRTVSRSDWADRDPDFTSRVSLVESIDQVMTPVVFDADRLRQALKPTMFVLPTTNNLALSVGNLPVDLLGQGVNVGLRADLEVGGRVVAVGRWYQESGSSTMTGRPVLVRFGDYLSTWQTNGPMTRSIESLVADGCVVRFSTDVEMALCAFECDKYWKGAFEVPLAELVK